MKSRTDDVYWTSLSPNLEFNLLEEPVFIPQNEEDCLSEKNEAFVVESFYLESSPFISLLYNLNINKYLKLFYLSEPFVASERHPQIRKKNKNRRFFLFLG